MLELSNKERKELRKYLPKEAIKELAAKYRLTVAYIRMIRKGTRNNDYVLMDMMRKASANKERLIKIKEKNGFGK